MECWSCGAERGEAVFCTTCEKIQPVSKRRDFFDILGLPRTFAQERAAVEKGFREGSRLVHPDRFGQTSPVERRLALEHTTQLNDAYRAIRDPERRAEYLMSLQGVTVGGEESRTKDPAFLMEMLELQEKVDEAKGADALTSFRAEIEGRRKSLLERLERYFDHRDGAQERAIAALDELRYLKRLTERIDVALEALA